MEQAAAVIFMLLLHAPDGHEIRLAPDQVTTMKMPRDGEGGHISKAVHCLINTTDGKFISVVETCDDVQRMIERVPK